MVEKITHKAKTDFPFVSQYLDIRGFRYHYIDEGQGDPILMVHGNPTWSYYFRHLILDLKNKYRVIVPDHIGCGLSSKPDDQAYSYTLADRIHDLELFCQALDLNKLTLVLHDWGGMIGLGFATAHVEKIKRLIITNTAAFPLPKGKRFPFILHLCRLPLVGPLLVRGLNLFCHGANYFCSVKGLPPKVREQYLLPYQNWESRRAILRFIEDIPAHSGHPTYQLIVTIAEKLLDLAHLPIQILWGERDFIFDHYFLNQWTSYFPNADIHLFHTGGHYLLEDKADEVKDIINNFLKDHPINADQQ